jgi:hypothetical protein
MGLWLLNMGFAAGGAALPAEDSAYRYAWRRSRWGLFWSLGALPRNPGG